MMAAVALNRRHHNPALATVFVAGMALIKVPPDQGATNAARHGPEKPAAKRVTSQGAASTADHCTNRPVTTAALMAIIAVMTAVTMPSVVVARIPIAAVLGEYGCCRDQRSR